VSKPLTETGVGEQQRSRLRVLWRKAKGSEERLGCLAPPLGVGVTARAEGVLTQSREGLAGSPDQVVGQRSAV